MKQRTAICVETLVLNPELIILDEPTSALDVVTQKMDVRAREKKVHEKTNVTVIFNHARHAPAL